MLTFLLLLAALVLFALAALSLAAPQRVNLVAAGLACWVLTLVIHAWPG